MSADEVEDIYPLTALQQGFLWHTLADRESGLGIEQPSIVLEGPFQIDVYTQAWQRVIDRHPVLRTGFAWEDLDEPLQIVYRHADVAVDIHDWRELSPSDQQQRLTDQRTEVRRRGFDITVPPLLRIIVTRLGEQTHQVAFSHHHIVLDGWSLLQAIAEAHAYYNALCSGEALDLLPAAPFRDYFVWLKERDPGVDERFWQRVFDGFTRPKPLQLDEVVRSPAASDGEAATHTFNVSAETTDRLRMLARQYMVTLGTLGQGVWAILLSRYTGRDDVTFGTVVAGRPEELPGIAGMLGMFINNLPVRLHVDGQARLIDWLKAVQDQFIDMHDYEHTPLGKIQDWIGVPPRVGLFDTLVAFQNYPVDQALMRPLYGGLETVGARSGIRALYPLTVNIGPRGPELIVTLVYDTRRFDADAVRRVAEHLNGLFEAIATMPDARLDDLPMLSNEDRQVLLKRGEQGYVLDARHRLLPPGVAGDLYVADPARSPVSMMDAPGVPNPFTDRAGAQLYATGQMAVHLPSGGLKLLGPIGSQVTAGSLRVDTSEIEERLAQHPSVRACTVAVFDASNEEAQFLAYVVPSTEEPPPTDELRRYLRTFLPDPFVPSLFRFVPSLSTGPDAENPNGVPSAIGAPRDGIEARLTEIWERVLGLRPIGVHDSFFDLGGTSFMAGRLLDQIDAGIGKRLSLAVLLRSATIARLADEIRGTAIPEGPVRILGFNQQGSRPPLFCAHGPFEYVLYYRYFAQHLGPDQPLYVLRWHVQGSNTLDFKTVGELADAYVNTMRAIQPEGPYYLLGHSFGGFVAYEMARQLDSAGDTIGLLAVLDTGIGEAHGGSGLQSLIEKAHRWIYVFAHLAQHERMAQLKERFRRTFTPRVADTVAQDAATRLTARYRPGAYAGRVTLFWANYVPRPLWGRPDPRDGWSTFAAGGSEVINVPGDHVLILAEPRVHALSNALRDRLLRAQNECRGLPDRPDPVAAG
jgi:thioesterase domain-containing protein